METLENLVGKAQKRPYLALAVLALALFLTGLFTVPPIDRDEARFAQASKQMIESGNFVDIRFQETPRYKKPIGIYWLQAASAEVFGADRISSYRLPSLLGAVLAVLFTFWAGTPLVGVRAALIGAALLAATVMLGAEARLAKTDAALLATIIAAQGVLARAYLAPRERPLPLRHALLFWAAQGAGILIKGPIAPLVSGLTVLALVAADRRADWLKPLRPWRGLAVLALIVAPWAVSIGLATDGRFFQEAVGADMMTKLAGGQESHGAPPGYYLVLALLTFWPGTLVLLPALMDAIKARAQAPVRFTLAWALPVWIVFELVPTKLPHYILPAYPAFALLCGVLVAGAGPRICARLPGKLALAAYLGAGAAFAALLSSLRILADERLAPADVLMASLFLTGIGAAALLHWRGRTLAAVAASLVASALLTATAFGLIAPGLERPWIAPRLVAALPRDAQGQLPPLIVSGFSEPSLVFLAGTGTRFLPPEDAAMAYAVSARTDTVVAVGAGANADFQTALAGLNLTVTPFATISGFNYSIGKPVTLTLYRRPS